MLTYFFFLLVIAGLIGLTLKKRSLDRWEGIVSLFLYGGYITFLIIKG